MVSTADHRINWLLDYDISLKDYNDLNGNEMDWETHSTVFSVRLLQVAPPLAGSTYQSLPAQLCREEMVVDLRCISFAAKVFQVSSHEIQVLDLSTVILHLTLKFLQSQKLADVTLSTKINHNRIFLLQMKAPQMPRPVLFQPECTRMAYRHLFSATKK